MEMGELTILNYAKAKTVAWDPDKHDEVSAAKALFDAYIDKGFSALRMRSEASEGSKIDRFDASAEKILMFPFLTGG